MTKILRSILVEKDILMEFERLAKIHFPRGSKTTSGKAWEEAVMLFIKEYENKTVRDSDVST